MHEQITKKIGPVRLFTDDFKSRLIVFYSSFKEIFQLNSKTRNLISNDYFNFVKIMKKENYSENEKKEIFDFHK